MSFKIGISQDYDKDIDFVELYLNYYNDKNSSDLNYQLFEFYKNKLSEYYQATIDYILEKNIQKYDVENAFELYEKCKNDAFNQFYNSKKFDLGLFYKAFRILGLIQCNDFNPNIYDSNFELRDDILFLPNNDGEFGFNTFLYAYYHGLYLICLPDHYASADRILYCPERFLDHDIVHIRRMRDPDIDNEKLRSIYYHVMNDDKISIQFKKLLLLFIFLFVHEYTQNINTMESAYTLFYQVPGVIETFSALGIFDEFDSFLNASDFEEKYFKYFQNEFNGRNRFEDIYTYKNFVSKSLKANLDPKTNRFNQIVKLGWLFMDYVLNI